MGKDILVGNGRREVPFQDVFKTIKNNDRIIMSQVEPYHTLIDGMNIPKDCYTAIEGRENESVVISAGFTVQGELHLKNLTIDFGLTDERSGERIYVDGGKLTLENVKIIGSKRMASPVFINGGGELKMKRSVVDNIVERSYALELREDCNGDIYKSELNGIVVNSSSLLIDDCKITGGVYVKESSRFIANKSTLNFYDSVDPRNIYITDSQTDLNLCTVIGDINDNPIRGFNANLTLTKSDVTDVRAKGFGVELNDSKATFDGNKVRGVFLKNSQLTEKSWMTVYGFFELYAKSHFKVENLAVMIVPPVYSMQIHENSTVEIKNLSSPYNPIMRVVDSELTIDNIQSDYYPIAVDVSGSYKVNTEDKKTKIQELMTDVDNNKVENQQSNEQPTVKKGKALEQLNNLIGLGEVKDAVKKFINLAKINKAKEEKGLPVRQSSLHSVYLGNPGTGKTTVARLVGQALYEEGALSNNKFVEVSRQDLVSGYLGKTTEITLEKLKSAHGGVFFLDEAYTLNSEGGTTNYGQEALDTILKYMEDNRDDIMIIFAGYTKEMYDFFNMNPGLKSRIPHYFKFEDYSTEELGKIGIKELENEHYEFDHQKYAKELKKAYSRSTDGSNARFVRNFNEKLILEQSNRVAESGTIESDDFLKITDEDWTNLLGNESEAVNSLKALHDELNSMTGLDNVKTFINQLIKEAQANKMFEERGIDVGKSSYHMSFTGPPGTGKTTIARLIAKFFKALDILPDDKVIEVDRSDLVGSYIGHTEKNTSNAIDRAMGGVLFIDEAYQLSIENSDNDFGKQAIETLITAMENNREKFIVIFAGYTADMERFMSSNEGLRSRVPYTLEFPQFSAEEVAEIVVNNLKNQWRFNEDFLRMAVINKYESLKDQEKTSGRYARNFTQKLLMMHKNYIVNENVEPDNFDFIIDSTILSIVKEES
ncbi:AAA family ATPase [Jeotgalicoccus sp. ATCC 8456]|uniref:AAA family ATPase n=1 Tax=Jeotgalicoccus sp. ATCC 8456 TaxID=946435 RepID=UPI0018E5B813|nr:AAA family ATPase [Jeotgalicoccus sp. ATCC 8456]QQD85225.1 AAA family ATPase [Jeotgalicoccus sp. ATCC 8456]